MRNGGWELDKNLEGGGRGLIQVVSWCCLEGGRWTNEKIVAIAGVMSEIRTEEHPNTRVECYQYSRSSRVSFCVNTWRSQGGRTASPPTLIASYVSYLQPAQHKTWNQLHRQLVPLWSNVGLTGTTDELITRTTGIALCSFDSLLSSSCNVEDQKIPAFNKGEKKNQ